jgi:hypothetical protein
VSPVVADARFATVVQHLIAARQSAYDAESELRDVLGARSAKDLPGDVVEAQAELPAVGEQLLELSQRLKGVVLS